MVVGEGGEYTKSPSFLCFFLWRTKKEGTINRGVLAVGLPIPILYIIIIMRQKLYCDIYDDMPFTKY